MDAIEKIWNKVRNKDAGDAEYATASPDFRTTLGHAAGEARAGRSTGIAGLEKFEEAVAKDAGKTLTQSGVDAARSEGSDSPSVFDAGARQAQAEARDSAKKEAKVSGKEKALRDAAGVGQKVEADEVNSPSFPSAARPLAAEAPGNAEPRSISKKATAKTATKAASKAATKTASKTAGKSRAKAASKK